MYKLLTRISLCLLLIAFVGVITNPSSPLTSPAIAQLLQLEDGEECGPGGDCMCGVVVCAEGCTCELTGPSGICTDCPIPEVPPGTIPWPYIVAGAILVLVVAASVFRIGVVRLVRRLP